MKKNKLTLAILAAFAFILVTMQSCDDEIDRTFHTFVNVNNLTANNDSIYIEQTIDVDSTATYLIDSEHNWHYHIGTYYGYITQKFPPEDFLMESMPEITIYKQKNGEITYLPRRYYDNIKDDFNVFKDVFFDIHNVMYVMEITDEMFEE